MLKRVYLLCANNANGTPWSSPSVMLNRHVEHLAFFLQTILLELSQVLLAGVENGAVDALLKKLLDLGFVKKALQDKSVTSAETSFLFDEVILRFPSSLDKLGTKAGIIENEASEWAIVKI